jgi:hypothetical protein
LAVARSSARSSASRSQEIFTVAIAEAERRLPPMLRHAAGAPDDLDAAPERNGRSTVRTSPADSWLTICEHERSAAFASLVTWTSRTRLVGSARRLLSPADADVGRGQERIVVAMGDRATRAPSGEAAASSVAICACSAPHARRSASADAGRLDDGSNRQRRDAGVSLPFQASDRARAAALMVVPECSHGVRVIASGVDQ